VTSINSAVAAHTSPCTPFFITFLCFANGGTRISTEVWRFEVAFGPSKRKQPFPEGLTGVASGPRTQRFHNRERWKAYTPSRRGAGLVTSPVMTVVRHGRENCLRLTTGGATNGCCEPVQPVYKKIANCNCRPQSNRL